MSGLEGLGQATTAFGGTSPTDLATSLVARASLSGSVDTAALNRDLAELARTDPTLAAQTRAQVEAQLAPVDRGTFARPLTGTLPDGSTVAFSPDGMEQGRWIDTIRTSANPTERAIYDNLVRTAGSPDPEAIKTVLADAYARGVTPNQIGAPAASPANDNLGILGRIAKAADAINPLNRLSDLVQSGAAEIGRSAGLVQTEWGARLQTLLDTPGTATAFRQGINEGILEGGKDMVVGVAGLAGRGLQYGADRGLGGFAGDALRSVTGNLPGWADAIVPSANRADATQVSVGNTANAIGNYVASRAANRSLIASDATAAFDKAWGSLKGDHAAAAAQGPEAEARWFGQAIGRVTFEVGSTFVPVVGVAGKVDKAADAARAVDAVADGARAADATADVGRATSLAGRTLDGSFGANTARWTFDDGGRLIEARANLTEVHSGLTRSSAETTAQRNVAVRGIEGDHGGHAVPHRFISDQGEINMFPQNGVPDGVLKNFNGSAFKTLENELADWVSAGGRVDYRVEFSDFVGERPSTVSIEYKVFNQDGKAVYDNRDLFDNEPGQVFDRLSRAQIETRLKGE